MENALLRVFPGYERSVGLYVECQFVAFEFLIVPFDVITINEAQSRRRNIVYVAVNKIDALSIQETYCSAGALIDFCINHVDV